MISNFLVFTFPVKKSKKKQVKSILRIDFDWPSISKLLFQEVININNSWDTLPSSQFVGNLFLIWTRLKSHMWLPYWAGQHRVEESPRAQSWRLFYSLCVVFLGDPGAHILSILSFSHSVSIYCVPSMCRAIAFSIHRDTRVRKVIINPHRACFLVRECRE